MADTSPKYDAVPLYDVEEQGFYDHYYQYDKHDNIKDEDLAFEEEIAAITDGLPGPSEWRRTLCTIGVSMTILAFVMTLVLYPLGPDVGVHCHTVETTLSQMRLMIFTCSTARPPIHIGCEQSSRHN